MDTMTRLRASFRSSTRRKKKKKVEDADENIDDDDGMDVYFQEIELEMRPSESFRPSDLRILFSIPDKGIEVLSNAPSPWEPSMKSSLNGVSVWVPPFSIKVPWTAETTHDGFFLLEDFKKKKRKSLAKTRISLKDFALSPPHRLKLRPLSRKIVSATLNLSFKKLDDKEPPLISAAASSSSVGAPLESLSLAEEDELSSEISPKSQEISSYTDHPSLENIPDIPYKESPSKSLSHKHIPKEQPLKPNQSPLNKPNAPTNSTSLSNQFDTKTPPPKSSPPPPPPVRLSLSSPKKPVQPTTHVPPPVVETTKTTFIPIFRDSPEEDDVSDLVVIPEGLLSVHNNSHSISNNYHQRDLAPSPTRPFEDDELLEWTKFRLSHSDRIKITNLTSSWRNGIGYCVLLHSKYPELIPLASLENHNHESNRKLASDVVEFLGGQPLVSTPSLTPTKEDIILFLKEIKRILSDKGPSPSAEEIKKWKEQSQWFREDETDSSPSTPSIFEQYKESSPEKSSSSNGVPPATESPTKNEKAKKLIQEAHSNFGVTFRRNKSPTTSSPKTLPPPEVRQSVILLKKELISLSEEEERIKREKNELEMQLRNEVGSNAVSPNLQNKKLKRWIELVNERHSLVRRQMQLNIKEKESHINSKLEALRARLHEFEEISESLKTEEMRNEEQSLLEELVKTVNEKNELVHHLDNEEKAIDEDERIKTMLEEQTLSGKSLSNISNLKVAGVGADECVIQ